MNTNRILMEITRGEWLIDHNNIAAYAPLLDAFFAGKAVYTKPELTAVSSFLNEKGRQSISQTNIAYINMSGVLTRYGDWCTYGAEDYVSMLQDVEDNNEIQGTVIFFNGPGGSVEAIAPIMEFAMQRKKPIVGLISTAASAHYWTACELCDHLMMENSITSRVGSVGVMATLFDVRKAMEQKGIQVHEIYAPESEHKNEVFNKALNGEYDQIKQEELSPIARAFQAAVRNNRPKLVEETGVLTGKMFFADDAIRLGMADSIGNTEKAVQVLEMLTEINS